MTSIAVWTTWLIPYMYRMLMGIPIINLSANAASGTALIGAGTIGLILYLRGDGRRARPRLRPALSEDVQQRHLSSERSSGPSPRNG